MGEGHKKWGYRKFFFILLAVGVVAIACLLVWNHKQKTEQALREAQQAATAAVEKIPDHLIGGLILLRPEQIISTPVADGFQWPCGAVNGAMIYDAQPFGAQNQRRGGQHTGQDLNGIGGGNSDEGLPVYAAGRGLVVYSGAPSADWGNVIVIAHRLPGQEGIVQTLYAHLKERHARVGEIVSRGEYIGNIGTADGRYLAHLHFEAIPSLCVEAGMPGYHPNGTMNRMDPAKLLRQYPAPPFPDILQSVRRIRIRESAAQHKRPGTAPQQSAPGVIHVSPEQFL